MAFLRCSSRKAILLACVTLASAFGFVWSRNVSSLAPKRAFYYWKTRWVASPQVLANLKENAIDTLYVRFFDVGWDDVGNAAQPISALEFQSPLPDHVEIVPVVYLVNNVFLNIPYSDVEQLADNVRKKIRRMASDQRIRFDQVQIDCDWTDGSRRNYFHFAELLGRQLKDEGKSLSATIRLHQIKYAGRTGIPPVDRGMLMFYNFGRIQADASRSSIFNAEDASRYSNFIESYRLPLDVVLPAFSWSVHSREGEVVGVLEQLTTEDLDSFEGFRKLSPNRYRASRSFFFRGRYFVDGDLVVVEETTPEMTREAATLAQRGVGRKRYATVALFDLDEGHLDKVAPDTFGGVLATF
jgi:hypothetical protein